MNENNSLRSFIAFVLLFMCVDVKSSGCQCVIQYLRLSHYYECKSSGSTRDEDCSCVSSEVNYDCVIAVNDEMECQNQKMKKMRERETTSSPAHIIPIVYYYYVVIYIDSQRSENIIYESFS